MRLALVLGSLIGLAACRPPGYGKPPPPDASEGTDGQQVVVDAALDAPGAVCDHAFRLDGYATSASVWLTGNFVSWAGSPQAGAIEFAKGNDGAWTGSYSFQAGTWQYKLIIDGTNWILDPTNPTVVDDGMGHMNNAYTCVP